LWILCAACLLGFFAALGLLVGNAGVFGAIYVILTGLPPAVAIFLAAGGWGYLVVHKLFPPNAGDGLKAVTSVAAGLWVLATAVLVAGSAADGALTPAIWWPVMVAGWALCAYGCRGRFRRWGLPRRVRPASLIWIPIAIAAGLWLAGATMPPGTVGGITADAYDVVSYQLQVPREFYEAGRISFLPHNTYSNYPLGAQMLFLLGMCLKGGALDGVYVAKFTHGLWAVLAAVTICFALPGRDDWRRRSAAVLLATAPMVIYLSWLAFVELSELAYLAIGVAWLAAWLDRPGWRSAAMVGLACGGACATKYLSVGLVAGPLLAIMLMVCIRRPRRLGQLALACVVCAAIASPWLIRNLTNTGNPVFPLASGLFGHGHWVNESVARWNAGHAPPPICDRFRLFIGSFLDERGPGPVLWVLAAAGALWAIISRRKAETLDRLCLGLVVLQLAIWAMGTHMPVRFLAPAAVPLAILAGGLIARLAWLARLCPARLLPARWGGSAPPVMLLAGAIVLNLLIGVRLYRLELRANLTSGIPPGLNGLYPDELPEMAFISRLLPPGARMLRVGDARVLNCPTGTLYASAWEMDQLVHITRQTRDPVEIIRRLHDEWGVTHLWINWGEIHRLRTTYGWWPEIDHALIDGLITAGAHDVPIFNRPVPPEMKLDGRPIVQLLDLPKLRGAAN